MVIVSILLLVVLTMTMRFLLDIMSREQEGVTSKRAGERSMIALEQMGQDFRSTISLDRATGGGLGLDDLDFVETDYIPPAGTQRTDFVDEYLDIVVATPWTLQLMVPSGGGTRCVTYAMDQATGQMTRTLADSCAPGATRRSMNVVVPKAPDGATPIPASDAPFRYWAYGPAPACQVLQLGPTASMNALTGVGIPTLYRLASVEVNLKAFAQSGRAKSVSKMHTEFTFRSRMSAPYRRAGGCTT